MFDTSSSKITLSDLPKNWKEDVITLYRDGASDSEVRTILGVRRESASQVVMSTSLFKRLMDEEPEFKETIDAGRCCAEAWHQQAGRNGMFCGNKFSAPVFTRIMQNRFGWNGSNSTTNNTYNSEGPMKINIEFVDPPPQEGASK